MKHQKPLVYLMFDRGTTRFVGTSNSPASRVRQWNEVIGGIATAVQDAKIIHGGLSSPFWLEPDGEAGIPGARIEPIDRPAVPT